MTDFTAIALKAARQAIAEAEREEKLRAELQLVLQSDVALAVWVRNRLMTKGAPVVRASTYETVPSDQDIWSSLFGSDPRRPVIMRGAKELMVERHGKSSSHCANGLCDLVAERYLRIIKHTCFDTDEHWRLECEIHKWAKKRHYISYHFRNNYWRHRVSDGRIDDQASCWVLGKYVTCTRGTFLALKKKHTAPPQPAPKPRKKLKRAELDREARIVSRALYELGIIQPGETL